MRTSGYYALKHFPGEDVTHRWYRAQQDALRTNVEVFLQMGDGSIKGLSYIAKRKGEQWVIPGFDIEKSKRLMIAEDIRPARDSFPKTVLSLS